MKIDPRQSAADGFPFSLIEQMPQLALQTPKYATLWLLPAASLPC